MSLSLISNPLLTETENAVKLSKVNRRLNPPGMLRILGRVDLLKTLKRKFSAKVLRQFREFPHNLPVGTPAANFTIQTVLGEIVSLSDYQGHKHVVLEFGSFT